MNTIQEQQIQTMVNGREIDKLVAMIQEFHEDGELLFTAITKLFNAGYELGSEDGKKWGGVYRR